MVFADRLQKEIERTGSCLVAGCDPVLDSLPGWLHQQVAEYATTDKEYISRGLEVFTDCFLNAAQDVVAAIKPNIAFFEQYGIDGLVVFDSLCRRAKERGLQVIADAKRGDIGSTAMAYSRAFLGGATVKGRNAAAFHCDALTVNPFLGFDTLEPFVEACQENGKGLFILVQTSNPGAKEIQSVNQDGRSVSERVASWIAEQSDRLRGACGWSGLGAVVGAPYPDEARRLREVMQEAIFLIPGLGAQGGQASESIAGFGSQNGRRGGGLVNASRGLLIGDSSSPDSFCKLITSNIERFNSQISQALHD